MLKMDLNPSASLLARGAEASAASGRASEAEAQQAREPCERERSGATIARCAAQRANPSFSAKNPECNRIRDFYFFTLHFSLKNTLSTFESKK